MPKKRLIVASFIFVFLSGIFLSAFVFRPAEETYVCVGYVLNTHTGQSYPIYAEQEIPVEWYDFNSLQVRLVLPREKAENRTTIVFYTKYGR